MEAGEFWSIGDYSIVGEFWGAPGRDLAASIEPDGLDVIDLATGTGVTAIAMAERGARSVVGVDAAPKLLREAERRANAAAVDIEWIEADVAAVPLPDRAADLVVSTFGIIVADDPRTAIGECRRLVRPGGRIVLTSWSGQGLFGRIRQALGPYFPDAPEPWHEDAAPIRAVVGPEAEVTTRSFMLTAETPEAFVAKLEQHNPPFIVGARALGDRWPRARADLLDVVAAADQGDADGYRAVVDYLVITIDGVDRG
ncbi:MAG: class I SAM-dependent methyltransferase [Actinomycetota bacterium]